MKAIPASAIAVLLIAVIALLALLALRPGEPTRAIHKAPHTLSCVDLTQGKIPEACK